MNLKFLGDALDHWKGSLFESLQTAKILQDFAVDLMASDIEPWKQEDLSLFARLRRINNDQIIPHRFALRDRGGYFAEISHSGDLFLDPDTGVVTKRVKERQCYVYPTEIRRVLEASSNRLLIIYQHVRGQRTSIRVDNVLGAIRKQISGLAWCSYESSTLAIGSFALKPERTIEVAAHFRNLLGSHADRRIRSDPPSCYNQPEEQPNADQSSIRHGH